MARPPFGITVEVDGGDASVFLPHKCGHWDISEGNRLEVTRALMDFGNEVQRAIIALVRGEGFDELTPWEEALSKVSRPPPTPAQIKAHEAEVARQAVETTARAQRRIEDNIKREEINQDRALLGLPPIPKDQPIDPAWQAAYGANA